MLVVGRITCMVCQSSLHIFSQFNNMTKCTIKKMTGDVAPGNISVSQKRKHYRLYNNDIFFKSLITFFLQDKPEPLHAFCQKENMNRSTFRRFFFESGLHNLKENGIRDEEQAKVVLNAYFEKKFKNRSDRTKNAWKQSRYLSDNEEHAIIQLCRLLGGMGYGITRDELQDIISSVTNWNTDEREFVEVSDKVVRGLFSRHGEHLKIVQASSLDPKRAKQASKETRDRMFMKLDSYICLLHAIGLVPWTSYQEIPPDCLYNMDELGNDTTKHRKKVVVAKTTDSKALRAFVKTPEGDGRMPWHITVCLTTRADGKSFFG